MLVLGTMRYTAMAAHPAAETLGLTPPLPCTGGFLLENVMCELSEDEAAKYYLIKGFEAHFQTLKQHMMLMDYNDLSEAIQSFSSAIMDGEFDV